MLHARPRTASARPLPAASLLLAAALALSGAHAQSINVDFNAASGPGAGVPGDGFGGAAGQPGRWNAVDPTAQTGGTLLGLAGTPTGVTLTRSLLGNAFGFNNTATGGDFGRLLDDVQEIPIGQTTTLTFAGLAPGEYEVYTYAVAPDAPTLRTLVSVAGAAEGERSVGGTVPPDALAEGTTHARHTVTVTGGTLTVTARPGVTFGSLNGVQIKRVPPARLYVDGDVPPGGDGRSWATAHARLSDALALADARVSEIWVAAGVYYPTGAVPSVDRDASFKLRDGLAILGGFAGHETDAAQRDAKTNPTVLSGGIGAAASGWSRAVVLADSVGPTAVLDGFIVTRGRTEGSGAGLLVRGASPRVRSCVFTDNAAGQNGGGVRVEGGAPRFEGCEFTGNAAGRGGAVSIGATADPLAAAVLARCRFVRNSAGAGGGGAIASEARTVVQDSLLVGNTAAGAAGGALGLGSTLHLANCTVFGNAPAGVLSAGGAVSLANTVLWSNGAGTEASQIGSTGGALRLRACTLQGWTGALGGTANNGHDPRFVDATGPNAAILGDEDLRPAPKSPLIDSGSNDAYLESGATGELDLTGLARLLDDAGMPDAGAGPLPRIDRGAFEFAGRSCPADADGSGEVRVSDLFAFLRLWFSADPAADADRDGRVAVTDVFAYLRLFFRGC